MVYWQNSRRTVAVGKHSFVGENASGWNQLRCTAASSQSMSR